MRHRLFACALTALIAAPAAAFSQEATTLSAACPATPERAADAAAGGTDMAGVWDFYMDVGGIPSFGLLAIGKLDGRYGGTLTPVRTAPVVLRRLTVTDRKVEMVVGSGEGDVIYTATLAGAGDRLCGVVAYHGGRFHPMVAQKRRR